MDFSFQGKHAPSKLAAMLANSSQVHMVNGWLTDTGCSDHVTPNLANLSLQQQPTTSSKTVTVDNGQELPVTHIGNGELCTSTHNFKLDGILRVPYLASNLLFVHKLCLHNNAFCYFNAYRFFIQDSPTGKILHEGLSKDGVYPIPALSSLHSSNSTAFSTSQVHQSSQASTSLAQISLWHNRLGHPSAKLLHFAIRPINPAFTFNKINECCSSYTYCISAKMHRLPLKKHEIQSNSMLQLVHSDIWGPAPISSLLGYNYYVVFIDDFTRFTWFFLLKQKHELFTVFKHFKNLVETLNFKIFVLTMVFFIRPPVHILPNRMEFLRESIGILLRLV